MKVIMDEGKIVAIAFCIVLSVRLACPHLCRAKIFTIHQNRPKKRAKRKKEREGTKQATCSCISHTHYPSVHCWNDGPQLICLAKISRQRSNNVAKKGYYVACCK